MSRAEPATGLADALARPGGAAPAATGAGSSPLRQPLAPPLASGADYRKVTSAAGSPGRRCRALLPAWRSRRAVARDCPALRRQMPPGGLVCRTRLRRVVLCGCLIDAHRSALSRSQIGRAPVRVRSSCHSTTSATPMSFSSWTSLMVIGRSSPLPPSRACTVNTLSWPVGSAQASTMIVL